MSYYDYDPNSSYYYDDYHQYSDTEFPYDDQNLNYRQVSQQKRFAGSYMSSRNYISSTRNSLHNYYIVSQESIPDESQYTMPHYVVPVVYAPSKVVSLGPNSAKMKINSLSQENVDRFYNDKRNLSRDNQIYRKSIEYSPREVIQEETESFPSGSELFDSLEYDEEVSDEKKSDKERADSKKDNKEKNDKSMSYKEKIVRGKSKKGNPLTDSTLILTDSSSKKSNKDKRKLNRTDAKGDEIKRTKKKNGSLKKYQSSKEESSEISSDYQQLKSKVKIKTNQNKEDDGNKIKKPSTKTDFLTQISHSPISCIPNEIKNTMSKIETKTSKSISLQLQEEKEPEIIGNSAVPSANSDFNYCSVSDFSTNLDKSQLIAWRNKTISAEESTAEATTSHSSEVSRASHVASKDSTDVTVNTEEYEEFIASIIEKPQGKAGFASKLFNETFTFEKSDRSLDFKYDINNSPVSVSISPTSISTTMVPLVGTSKRQQRFEQEENSATEIEVKTTVSMNKNMSVSSCEGKQHVRCSEEKKLVDAKNSLECHKLKMSKTNQLRDTDCDVLKVSKINPLLDVPLNMASLQMFRNESRSNSTNTQRNSEVFASDGQNLGSDDNIHVSSSLIMKLIRFFESRIAENNVKTMRNNPPDEWEDSYWADRPNPQSLFRTKPILGNRYKSRTPKRTDSKPEDFFQSLPYDRASTSDRESFCPDLVPNYEPPALPYYVVPVLYVPQKVLSNEELVASESLREKKCKKMFASYVRQTDEQRRAMMQDLDVPTMSFRSEPADHANYYRNYYDYEEGECEDGAEEEEEEEELEELEEEEDDEEDYEYDSYPNTEYTISEMNFKDERQRLMYQNNYDPVRNIYESSEPQRNFKAPPIYNANVKYFSSDRTSKPLRSQINYGTHYDCLHQKNSVPKPQQTVEAHTSCLKYSNQKHFAHPNRDYCPQPQTRNNNYETGYLQQNFIPEVESPIQQDYFVDRTTTILNNLKAKIPEPSNQQDPIGPQKDNENSSQSLSRERKPTSEDILRSFMEEKQISLSSMIKRSRNSETCSTTSELTNGRSESASERILPCRETDENQSLSKRSQMKKQKGAGEDQNSVSKKSHTSSTTSKLTSGRSEKTLPCRETDENQSPSKKSQTGQNKGVGEDQKLVSRNTETCSTTSELTSRPSESASEKTLPCRETDDNRSVFRKSQIDQNKENDVQKEEEKLVTCLHVRDAISKHSRESLCYSEYLHKLTPSHSVRSTSSKSLQKSIKSMKSTTSVSTGTEQNLGQLLNNNESPLSNFVKSLSPKTSSKSNLLKNDDSKTKPLKTESILDTKSTQTIDSSVVTSSTSTQTERESKSTECSASSNKEVSRFFENKVDTIRNLSTMDIFKPLPKPRDFSPAALFQKFRKQSRSYPIVDFRDKKSPIRSFNGDPLMSRVGYTSSVSPSSGNPKSSNMQAKRRPKKK